MKLTEKECNKAYENLCETFDKYIDTSRKDLFVFANLIKEHFELVEEYKSCRKELESCYDEMSHIYQQNKALEKACEKLEELTLYIKRFDNEIALVNRKQYKEWAMSEVK